MSVSVLHVYKDVHPDVHGGIERHIDDLRRLPGVESSVLVGSRSRRTRIRSVAGGAEVAVGELGRLLSAPLAPTFPLWLHRMPADVVHLHLPNPTGEVAALVASAGRPIIASYHADIVRQAVLLPLYAPVVDAVLRRAAVVVSGTHAMLRTSPLLSKHAGRARVIPYGVDTDRLSPAAADPAAVTALRRRFGARVVVATGRLVYYKGFDRLIRLAERVDASIVIAGTGPLSAELGALAARAPRAHLLGSVTDAQLRDVLAAADVFVLPSVNRAESFGIATLEAQSMGLPAVVTDVGTGTVEAIEPDHSGIVVASGDDDALVRALRTLLDDVDLRARFGVCARARAVAGFSMRATADRWARLYAEVAGSGKGSR
ncbi:MAG TPA: glycosyltransferase [Solirubrobacteraceae bacterium]